MRPATIVRSVQISIAVKVEVVEDGKVLATTMTTSHGNAEHRSLFQLTEWATGEWAVTETSTDLTLFVATTKADALDKIARRVSSDAARWAIG